MERDGRDEKLGSARNNKKGCTNDMRGGEKEREK